MFLIIINVATLILLSTIPWLWLYHNLILHRHWYVLIWGDYELDALTISLQVILWTAVFIFLGKKKPRSVTVLSCSQYRIIFFRNWQTVFYRRCSILFFSTFINKYTSILVAPHPYQHLKVSHFNFIHFRRNEEVVFMMYKQFIWYRLKSGKF